MANSLRNKIKHFYYKGELNERERDRILNALDDADRINSELEPCDDCISRDETLKAFAEKCGGECGCCVYNGSGYDSAENCKLIKSMPPVTPKAKIGKWMPHMVNDKFESIDHDVCSECHTCFYGERTWDYKYCPNCGARMAESEDKE